MSLDESTRDEIARLTERIGELADLQRRMPSKAHLIGQGPSDWDDRSENAFFSLVAKANSARLAGGIDGQLAAKAALDNLGAYYAAVPGYSKATVGDSDAAGGYLIPNAVVADITEQATPRRAVVDLFSQVGGIEASSIDLPWESAVPLRATIVAPGVTKENSDFTVNNYSATFYTLARILDVGNQLLRNSRGAAEAHVRSKLARAFALGEDYYAVSGTGSGQPMGLLTALGTTGTYVSTFSSPSDSTLAGSVASAVATAAGDLEARGAEADGIAMNVTDYWRMRRQGSDTAGYWIDPDHEAGVRSLSLFGIPVRPSAAIPSDTLVVGEFKSVTFYRGQGYRVDSSSEAGTRWDQNLTGFRGEEEIAFNPQPQVFAGKFQRIINAVS